MFCFATDGEAKKSIKPETAQERHRADGYKMNPEDMASIGKHLECAKKTKDWQAALADVNKLLEFETQYDGYYRERADICRALGRADLAAADDKKAIELHKKNAGKLRYD